MKWLIRHFQRYRQRGPWAFCWRISIEGLLATVLCALVLTFLFPELDREFPDWDPATMFMIIVVLAPIFETLLLQALPIYIARKFKAPFGRQVIISMAIFAGLHFLDGVAAGLCAGMTGGFYFAFTFAHWRDKSRWTAFWITAVSHAFNNFVAFVAIAVSGQL
jgi:hypothetical protein